MRNLLGICVLIVGLAGCEASFDATSFDQPLPAVYCLLNLNDSIQELRLSKTFIPDEKGFDGKNQEVEVWNESADIYIEEYRAAQQPSIYTFARTEEPVRQDSGFFATPSYQLYQSHFKPRPNTRYVLYVFLPSSGRHTFAETITIDQPHIADPTALPGREINFSPYDDYRVHFYPPINSGYHIAFFRFGDWEFARHLTEQPTEQGLFVSFSSERFFNTLNPTQDYSFGEFYLASFGREMGLYNRMYSARNVPWENLAYSSFSQGVGLFSSVAQQRISNLPVSEITLRLIEQGFTMQPASQTNPDSLGNNGLYEFNFTMPPSDLPVNKTHRMSLNLAYSADSVYKNLFFATANVSDTREQYHFILPAGSYYYAAGITCSCLADSCLWDGYPNGQFGTRYAINQFSVQKGKTTTDSPSFQ